jgi:glycerophosphoryl diester phosphodiesterase
MVTNIRQQGLGIVIWHEERPAELRELVSMEVDGICTNTPDVLSSILKNVKREE